MEHAISVVFGGLFHPRLVGGHELSQMIEWHQPILHPLGVELHEIQILPDIHQSTPHDGAPRSSISSAHFTGSDRQALVIESAPTRGIDIALIMYFHQTQRIDPVDWVAANISIEAQATIQVQRIFRDETPHAWMIVPRDRSRAHSHPALSQQIASKPGPQPNSISEQALGPASSRTYFGSLRIISWPKRPSHGSRNTHRYQRSDVVGPPGFEPGTKGL